MLILHIDPAIAFGLRLALAFVLFAAAAHKLDRMDEFKDALSGYGLVPQWAMPAAPYVLALMELTIAAGLLLFPMSFAAALSAGALFATYGTVMALTILRGRRTLDCGCGTVNQPLSWALVVRNLILLAIATNAATPHGIFEFHWLGWGTALFAAIISLLIYFAAESLLANQAQMKLAEVAR